LSGQILPHLADQGQYLGSESSFYGFLRAEGKSIIGDVPGSPVQRKPLTSYKASGPCEVWTWDITWMPEPVAEVFFYPYLIVDIFSRKIVGWVVHERECAELAAILIRQVVMAEGCIARPLVLHANKGSPMKGDTMKTTMEKLGITASYSRPRVSNDNPFSEALFQTCKYRPNWPTNGFATKADAQAWVKSSAGWYNGEHLHRAIRFVTPSARHTGHVRATLVNRARLYANAWAQNPHRWSGKTRNWQPDGPVWLDRERETSAP
jgi:putative transposase